MQRVAVHLRRLAEQHVHRQVDRQFFPPLRRSGEGRWAESPTCVEVSLPFHGRGGANACNRPPAVAPRSSPVPTTANGQRSRAHSGEFSGARRARPARSVLRFVAPKLHRRQRGIVAGHLGQVDHAADVGVVQQFGIAFDRPPAPTSCTEAMGLPSSPSAAQRSSTSWRAPFHFRVVALHAGEIEVLGAVAGGDELAAPPPRPISIAGPPSTMTASRREHALCRPAGGRSRRARRRA